MKVKDLKALLALYSDEQEIGIRIRDSGGNSYFDPNIEIQEVLELNHTEYSDSEMFGYFPLTDRTDLTTNKVLILE